MKLKWIINTTAIALLIFVAFLGLAKHDSVMAAEVDASKIEGLLLDRFAADGNADFIVRFTEQADLSAAYTMDWSTRGEYVYNTLLETANRSQANAISILNQNGFKNETKAGGNDLYVWGGTLEVANELSKLPEVYFIRATRTYYIDPVVVTKPFENISWAGDLLSNKALTTVGSTDAATAWGILDSKADQFWTAFGVKGAGIKVANIDTGVQWNHPALDQTYACAGDPGNADCWADPSNICGGTPCDNNGHGTHTMGTMVADDDPSLTWIAGMAPDSSWIACKGCETNSCSDYALTTCGTWILAPGGDPANRPNVVNNSWGGGGGDAWYQTYVQNWATAGIFPAFSAGNAGSSCNTLGSPGDYQVSFGSAAHDVGRNIASFSSRGASAFGHEPYTKPNISSPGVSVCSTVPTNGWSCGYSGTSMASPHTAGAVALLWSCNPSLIGAIDLTFQTLQNSANTPPAGNCGAPPDGQGNYTFGYGYLDVLNAGISACGTVETGIMDGYVLDQGNSPIEGATVNAQGGVEGAGINATTDPNGYYSMELVVGTYNVTASKANYTSQTVAGVEVLANQTTSQDFQLSFLGAWTQITPPPGCPDWTRYDGEYYEPTGLVYFMGGRSGTTTVGTIYSYDPVANTCSSTGRTMPTPISNYTINLVNNGTNDLLCTFGGRDSAGGSTLNVQCYNPNANTVSVVNTLPVAWTGFGPYVQVVLDNMVYIFGGFNSLSAPYMTARTDRYDPVTNTFTQMGNLTLARSYIMAAAVDGKIYAFGGHTFDGTNLLPQTIAEVFDPALGTWDDAAVADLPAPSGEGRAYGFNSNSGYALAGQIIMAGGGEWPNDTNEAISYNVATDSYDTGFPNLNISRRDHAGFFIPGDPGVMWVFGGRSSVAGYGGDNPPYAPPEYSEVSIEAQAPIIRIEPASVDVAVLPDAAASSTLTIFNDGNTDLTWSLYDGVLNPGWADNFDSYPTGFQLHGQGGWKGWDNVPGAGALTSDLEALSDPNSVAVVGATDLTHPYSGYTSGAWTYTAYQYIPLSFSGTTYFILLNTYNDGGPNNWSLQMSFDSGTNLVTNDGPVGGTLPMIIGQWVEIRVEIDLDADTQSVYYGGDLLFTGSWTEGMSGGGVLNIANVDLFANGASVVYYDDISLSPTADPICGVYGDVSWLSTDPTGGTTLPGEGTDVNVMFNASGLPVGLYEATLCAESDDPVTPLVPIPVSMTVESVDLGITKTDSPDPVRFGHDLTYTILVTNNSLDLATGVTVVDTLPAGVGFVSASAGCVEAAGVVTCDVGDLASGAVAEITIVVTAPEEEVVLSNTATVTGNELDPDLENNTATAETTVIRDIMNIYLPIIVKAP